MSSGPCRARASGRIPFGIRPGFGAFDRPLDAANTADYDEDPATVIQKGSEWFEQDYSVCFGKTLEP